MSAVFTSGDNERLEHQSSTSNSGAARCRRSASAGSDNGGGKRRKVRRACDSCKARKRRCTGDQPCPSCASHGIECTYNSPHGRARDASSEQQKSVMFEHAMTSTAVPIVGVQSRWPGATNGDATVTRRDEGVNTSTTSRAVSPNGEGITPAGYQGPTSTFSFLRRAWRRFGVAEAVPPAQHQDSREEASVFVYGDRRPPVLDNQNELKLPDLNTTNALIARYFDYAAPTYRFLHRPTFQDWVNRYHKQQESQQEGLEPIRQAIVLMVLATSCLYRINPGHVVGQHTPEDDPLQAGEIFYQAAQQKIATECGRPRLESVQARLATSLYQLNTSRLNQAWYTLGSTYQLVLSIGLHRKRTSVSFDGNNILRECQKRSFWAVHTLDTYLSVMLGRPPYINDAYVDQRYPDLLDDDDILPDRIVQRSLPKDCIQAAPVMHARLTRIVKEASKEQALSQHPRDQQPIQTAQRLGAEIDRWREQLPLFLSGGISPSSLVPVFRRQLTVLQLGCAHAVIIVNRPLILSHHTEPTLIQSYIEECLSAAKFVLDMVLDLASEKNLFPAFWYTQYITFNALTIVYVWIMQRKQGRLAVVSSQYDEVGLFRLAESVQLDLAKVTNSNAPSLRYSIILEELQQEVSCVLARSEHSNAQVVLGNRDLENREVGLDDMELPDDGTRQWDNIDMEFPIDPELWLQLDTLLFSTVEA